MNPRARAEGLVIQDVGDEVVVYDLRTHRVTRLNDMAVFVWRSCDGLRSEAELAAEVQSRFGIPGSDQIVSVTLAELDKAGLLHEDPERGRVTRRKAVQKMGRFATRAAIALPIVVSMLAPTPAMATTRGD